MSSGSRLVGARAKIAAVAVLAAGMVCVPGMSRAEDAAAKAAAKERLERGADLLVTHDYTAALQEFEGAYRLFPSPKIFFNIGLANLGLDRNPDALRAFQRFLVEASDATPDTVTRAKAQIKTLLPRVAVVDFVCPTTGTEILVDDRSVGRAPLSGPVYLDPGSHDLTARSSESGPPVTTKFMVTGGTRVTVSVPATATAAATPAEAALPAAPGPPPASSPLALVERPGPSDGQAQARPIYSRPWFWAVATGVVAVVGVTLLLTVGHSTKDPNPSLGRVDFPGSP